MKHLLYPGCFTHTVSTSNCYLPDRALPRVLRLADVYLADGQAAGRGYKQGLNEVFGQAS